MGVLKDGEYTIEVTLTGGSGRATVTSPTHITVDNSKVSAEIEWSSPNYDYMEVDGKEYRPVNESGNSTFLIDVPKLDEEIPVKAETLAMSEPHMIDYTLYFDSSTAKAKGGFTGVIIGGIVAVLAVSAVVMQRRNKRAKN